MKIVHEGESVTRTAKVDGNTVRFQHVTLHRPSKRKYLLNTAFDFTGVAQPAILRLAAEALLIRWRTAFKIAKTVSDVDDNKVVSVSRMLTDRKPRKDVTTRVAELAGKMTKEQLLKAMAEVQARLDAASEGDESEGEFEELEDELEESEK